jgi:hypothetical protein
VPPNDKLDAIIARCSPWRTTSCGCASASSGLGPELPRRFPPSRTRREISNVRITGVEDGLILVNANFAIFRHRRNEPVRQFVGRYRHKLKRTDEGLKFHERRAILDAEELQWLSVSAGKPPSS